MCGINIIASITPDLSDTKIVQMNKAIFHRGPDDEGVFMSPHFHLGMRRLSIIDIDTGKQPLFNEDKRYCVVFNGEIYNYRELRAELEKSGHCFSTNSDTEVIVHCYEQYGKETPNKLNGMFCFAIYDSVEESLFVSRDRVGQKPLYYFKSEDTILIASELKSIISVLDKKLPLSSDAISLFFALTFIPAPYTIYEEIFKLEPGCFLTIDKKLNLEKRKYWNLSSYISSSQNHLSKSDYVKFIRETLCDSVKKRMIADVPLGAFLSGGVDSSIVVSLMSKISSQPVKTFSIANKNKGYDESVKSQTVAKLFKTDHTEWIVDEEYFKDILEKVILNFDEPFADSSALPSFVVAELAKKHVTVALTGDGGDELYGGYSRYLIFQYLELYNKIPSFFRKRFIQPFVNNLKVPSSISLKYLKLKKIVNNSGKNSFERYHLMQRLGFSSNDFNRLFISEIADPVKSLSLSYFNETKNASPLQRSIYCDILMGLEGDMLVKLDRTSMLNSLEVRNPFLDYRLIEHSFSIPDSLKIHEKNLKYILKETFKDSFPKSFLDKPKQGFGIPIGEMLKNDLKIKMRKILDKKSLVSQLQIVNVEWIKQIYKNHCAGQFNTFQIWPFFVFGLWLEKNEKNIHFNIS